MSAKENLHPLDRKFQRDEAKFEPLKNKDLVCATCKKQYDDADLPCNTSKCEAFPVIKPYEVLSGGECNEYEEQQST